MSTRTSHRIRAAIPFGALLVAAATLAPSPASAQTTADGQALAQKLCSNCHATDPDAKNIVRADVPSFRAAANGPKGTPEALAAAIVLPHPEMPNIPLTRAEIRALITYIMSLKTP